MSKSKKARKKDKNKPPSPPARVNPRELVFTPAVYARLRHFANATENEVAAWGICEDPDNPLLVTDLHLPLQTNNPCYVEMDDDAINRYLVDQTILGRSPEQFMRVWIHTHPGASPTPSSHDRDTFERLTKELPWLVMFIMSEAASMTATYRGPLTSQPNLRLTPTVDYHGIHWTGPQTVDLAADRKLLASVENKGSLSPLTVEQEVQAITFPKDYSFPPKKKNTFTPSQLAINDATADRYGLLYNLETEQGSCFVDEEEDPTLNCEIFLQTLDLSPEAIDETMPSPFQGLEDITLLELHNLNASDRTDIIMALWATYIPDEEFIDESSDTSEADTA